MNPDKKLLLPQPISGVFVYEGVTRTPLESGVADKGDIVTLTGVPDGIKVGDTVTLESNPVKEPIMTPPLAPPTLSMDFGANDGPLAGKEGTIVQASRIRARLQSEVDNNVTLSIGASEESTDKSIVFARGELQLGILIEQMRREGYEMTISPPKIVFSEDEQGNVMEPFEEVRSEKRRQRAKRRRAGNASVKHRVLLRRDHSSSSLTSRFDLRSAPQPPFISGHGRRR